MNCPSCAESLSERGFFCKACAAQARCMRCREVLEAGAAACVECGTRIGHRDSVPASDAPPVTTPVVTMPPNRNTLTYREDRNSRSFDASLTDSAMHGLGDVFGELFARAEIRTRPATSRIEKDEHLIEVRKELPPAPKLPGEQPQPPPERNPMPGGDQEKERLLKIFNLEGETLELAENRLKAKSAADYYKRLTYLFAYAQEILLGRASTPKSDLVAVLKVAKVYDPNCRFWLKQKKGFTVDAEDRMKLIAGAKEQAKQTINEVFDGNVADDWNPDTRTVKARPPKKKKA